MNEVYVSDSTLSRYVYHTSPYHPQTDGALERQHNTSKTMLRTCIKLLDLHHICYSLEETAEDHWTWCVVGKDWSIFPLQLPNSYFSQLW